MKFSDTLFINGEPEIDGIKFLQVKDDNPEVLKSWFVDGVMPALGQKVDLVCTYIDDEGFCISLKAREEHK